MMQRALHLLGALLMAGFFFSCSPTFRSETQTNSVLVTEEETAVSGTIGGLPAELTVKRRLKTRGLVESTTTGTLQAPKWEIPWEEVGQAAVGGLLGSIPGVGGLLGLAVAGFAWWRKSQAEKESSQTVKGLDEVRKNVGDEVWKEDIAPHLRAAQDADVKARIKKRQSAP